MLKTTALPTKKKLGSNKFVLGFAALAATAVVGATGIAAAQTPGSGYGYGGNGDISTSVNVNVNGNNNVIHVILNIFR
jgi:hypothetical protein